MPKDLTLRLRFVDESGEPHEGPVDIDLRHNDQSTARVFKGRVNSGAQVDIDGLSRTPKGGYRLATTPDGHYDVQSEFITIPAEGFLTMEVRLRGPALAPLELPGGFLLPTGYAISSLPVWKKLRAANSAIPEKLEQVRNLASRLFPQPGKAPLSTTGALKRLDECTEGPFANFLTGLRNPEFSANHLIGLQTQIGAANRMAGDVGLTQHFEIHWLGGAAPPYKKDIERYLEEAWHAFKDDGFLAPLLPDPKKPLIRVDILDMERARGDTSVDGSIRLNRRYLDAPNGADAGKLRKALCVHELFHRVQYAYGFRRTPQLPAVPYQWFSEGTASWAEWNYAGTVTAAAKGLGFTRIPNAGLFGSAYQAMPFWQDTSEAIPGAVRDFFSRLAQTQGDGKAELTALIAASTGKTLPEFLMQWSVTKLAKPSPRPTPNGLMDTVPGLFELTPRPGKPAVLSGFARQLMPMRINVGNNNPGKAVIEFTGGIKLMRVDAPGGLVASGDTLATPLLLTLFSEASTQYTIKAFDPAGAVAPSPAAPAFSAPRGLAQLPVQVDELGNVILTAADGQTTVIGYTLAYEKPGVCIGPGRYSSINFSDSLATPAVLSGGLLPKAFTQDANQFGATATCSPSLGDGVPVGCAEVERKVTVSPDGKVITVATKYTGQGEPPTIELMQRTSLFGQPLTDHDSGGTPSCRGGDCDPLAPAGMPDPTLSGGAPGTALQPDEPWQMAPGWNVLPLRVTGWPGGAPPFTITQKYCIGDCAP